MAMEKSRSEAVIPKGSRLVALDERGNGETAPVELGAIISERV